MAVSARSKMLHHSIASPVHWNTTHSQECNTAGQQFIISLQKNAEHQQNTAHTISHCITLYYTKSHCTAPGYKSTGQKYIAPVQCTRPDCSWMPKGTMMCYFCWFWWRVFTNFRGTTHIDTEKVKQSWMAEGTMMCYFCWFFLGGFTTFRGYQFLLPTFTTVAVS